MTTNATPTAARGTSFRRRIVATTAVGAAAAVLAIALQSHVLTPASTSGAAGAPDASALSHDELASWTGTPTTLTATSKAGAAAIAWCEDGLASDSMAAATVSNLDQRGSIASMLVSRGGYSSFCLADGAQKGMWEIANEPGSTLPAVSSTTIDLGSEDQHGTPAVNSAWGNAGDDVRSVVLHTGGRTVTATVEHGFWTAWWPGATVPGAIQAVVTTTSGTTSTVALGS